MDQHQGRHVGPANEKGKKKNSNRKEINRNVPIDNAEQTASYPLASVHGGRAKAGKRGTMDRIGRWVTSPVILLKSTRTLYSVRPETTLQSNDSTRRAHNKQNPSDPLVRRRVRMPEEKRDFPQPVSNAPMHNVMNQTRPGQTWEYY